MKRRLLPCYGIDASMARAPRWRKKGVRQGNPANWLTRCRSALIEIQCRGGLIQCAKKLPYVIRYFGWKRGFKFLYKYIDRNDYLTWVRCFDTPNEVVDTQVRQQILGMVTKPKISILMPIESVPLAYLKEAIASVSSQSYPHWELCLVLDLSCEATIRSLLNEYAAADARIKLDILPQPQSMSAVLNHAFTLAEGDYVTTMACPDVLAPHALFYMAEAIAACPDVALLYSDEDRVSSFGIRYAPWFKCAFNEELLLGQNKLGHLVAYRSCLLKDIGGWRSGFEGAEDYELTLRVLLHIERSQIIHISSVLYHQRTERGYPVVNTETALQLADSGRRAVNEYLVRSGRGGQAVPCAEAPEYNRVRYRSDGTLPLVSMIIPTRDRADLLSMCLDSLLHKTSYPHYEIIIIDNGSVEAATQKLFDSLPKDRIRVLRDNDAFNYSRLNNLGARHARGDILCLMNNDIEILTPDWVEEMLSFVLQEDIGCVGARLWFPDGRLQHAGVITGLGGVAGHPNKFFPRGYIGYFGRAVLAQSLSAVTAACLMVRRTVWEQVNGLDETLAVAFNDVDFCLRVQAAGYRNVWTPSAEMNHHESASRGNETSKAKQIRYEAEIKQMQSRWGDTLIHDPAYNPNLTLVHDDSSLAWPPRQSFLST